MDTYSIQNNVLMEGQCASFTFISMDVASQ